MVTFKARYHLLEHKRLVHGGQYPCSACGKKFFSVRDRKEHFCKCESCEREFTTGRKFKNHVCIKKRKNEIPLASQAKNRKKESAVKSKNSEFPAPHPPIAEESKEAHYRDTVLAGLDLNPVIEEMYRGQWGSIRTHSNEGNVFHSYTFRWEGQTRPHWETWLRQVFNRQSQKFKLNYSHSSILWHTENKE